MSIDPRSTRLFIGLGVVAAILLAKIFSIQVLDDHYKIDADNNTTVREIIYPTRGVIYDRNGSILVGNRWNSSAARCRSTGRTAGRSASRASR